MAQHLSNPKLNDERVQRWTDFEFCRTYASTWEIATDQIHYGWLAPGEAKLQLLADFNIPNSCVLDIGCGMGENLIALAHQGAQCFGIDISQHMLAFGLHKSSYAELPLDRRPMFKNQDMRALTAFEDVEFDLALSVYSLEYVRSLVEFRDVACNIFNRLRPGGAFVACFSHPLQHFRHSSLFNDSALIGDGVDANLIYSFRDAVQIFTEVGFTLERIVEQETRNPSRISYEESLIFPYHFRYGKNPCQPKFDPLSNGAPHTIIYKCRKPKKPRHTVVQNAFEFSINRVRLWGEDRTITNKVPFGIAGRSYEILQMARKDSLVAVCRIADFQVWSGDLETDSEVVLKLRTGEGIVPRHVIGRSLLAIVNRRLEEAGLFGVHRRILLPVDDQSSLRSGTFLDRVEPIYNVMRSEFPTEALGILVFLNGEEPGSGKVSLESVFPTINDHVEVFYVASREGLVQGAGRAPNLFGNH